MSVLLAIAIWTGVSAICAPVIGRLLFDMNMDSSEPLVIHARRAASPRYSARRLPGSWQRRALKPSRAS